MSILEPFVQPIESKCVYDRVLGLANQQFVKSNNIDIVINLISKT